jgi:hypothetical protein
VGVCYVFFVIWLTLNRLLAYTTLLHFLALPDIGIDKDALQPLEGKWGGYKGVEHKGVEELAAVADPRDIVKSVYELEAHGEKPNHVFVYMRPKVEALHWKNKTVYDCQ